MFSASSFKRFISQKLKAPAWRGSRYFHLWQSLSSYSPHEKMVELAMKFVAHQGVAGDYLEFGVYQGQTFSLAYHMAQIYRLRGNMRFYAFDSFRGLPAIEGLDLTPLRPSDFETGQYSCSRPQFFDILRANKVDLTRVTAIEGWFDHTLTPDLKRDLPIENAAVIWIDCDLYESTVPVLEFVSDYIHTGTVIIFDDWYAFRGDPGLGERAAFHHWLAQNPEISATPWHQFDWHGKSFLMSRVARRDPRRSETTCRFSQKYEWKDVCGNNP
jgi:hypothetical protein